MNSYYKRVALACVDSTSSSVSSIAAITVSTSGSVSVSSASKATDASPAQSTTSTATSSLPTSQGTSVSGTDITSSAATLCSTSITCVLVAVYTAMGQDVNSDTNTGECASVYVTSPIASALSWYTTLNYEAVAVCSTTGLALETAPAPSNARLGTCIRLTQTRALEEFLSAVC